MYNSSPSVVDQIVERLKTPIADKTKTSETLTFKSPFKPRSSKETPPVTQRKPERSSLAYRHLYSKEGRLSTARLKLSPPSDDSDSETESEATALPRHKICVSIEGPLNGTCAERSNGEVVFEEKESMNNIWQSSPLLSKLEQQLKVNRLQTQREFATILKQTRKSFELEHESLPGGWKKLLETIDEKNRQEAAEEQRQLSDIEKQIFSRKEEKQRQIEERIDMNKLEEKSTNAQPVQEIQTRNNEFSVPNKEQETSAEDTVQSPGSKEPVLSNAESTLKVFETRREPNNSVLLMTTTTQSTPWKEQIGMIGNRSIIASSSALAEASACYQSLEDLRKLVSNFLKDSSAASYRLHLKKRVNLAANQIAASQKQILNKAHDIVDTLRKAGQSSKESQGYCFLCVVERLVEEGEKQVALHADSAFAIAAVIIAVAAEFSELKQLFLAEFHNACIFTIPAYAMRSKQDSVEKYWQSMGWKNGETLERFLERMSGYLALYAAVTQTEIPSLANNVFGIESGWTWVARVVNMKPKRFTAFMLISFLEIAGYALYNHYGRQFEKLLRLIEGHILPNLPSNAPPGPTARLQSFIQDFYNSKTIKEPQGRQLPTTDAENEDYSNGF